MENNKSECKKKGITIDLTLIVTTLVCLIPFFAGLVLWDTLPDTVASHFDAYGNPDGYSPKWILFVLFPAVEALFNVIIYFILKIKPVGKVLTNIICWMFPVISLFTGSLTIFFNLNLFPELDIGFCTIEFVGLVWMIIGNYLPKVPLESVNLPELSGVHDAEEANAYYKRLCLKKMSVCFVSIGLAYVISGFTKGRIIILIAGIALFLICVILSIAISQHKTYKKFGKYL